MAALSIASVERIARSEKLNGVCDREAGKGRCRRRRKRVKDMEKKAVNCACEEGIP